jgi:hypothetical protein
MILPSAYNTSISPEILELQRDGREIEVLYVLGSIIQKY